MINTAININNFKPILKQDILVKLKPLSTLEHIKIFAMPSRIQDKDITSLFKGLLTLLREKVQQEQTEKYLQLKLKYDRLKHLYQKLKH